MRRRALGKNPEKTAKDLCRKLVMLRDNETCQRCGRSGVRIEWAHVIGRNAPSIVAVPWNSLALCGPRLNDASCHGWFDNNKIAAMHWWSDTFSDRAVQLAMWRASIHRVPDRRLEAAWLRQEIVKMESGVMDLNQGAP